MLQVYNRTKLSGLVCLTSLITLVIVAMTTDPSSSAALIVLFLILLLAALIGGGFRWIAWRGSGAASRYKAVIFGVAVTLVVMFRSTHSLSSTDVIILLLSVSGLSFYINRRLNS